MIESLATLGLPDLRPYPQTRSGTCREGCPACRGLRVEISEDAGRLYAVVVWTAIEPQPRGTAHPDGWAYPPDGLAEVVETRLQALLAGLQRSTCVASLPQAERYLPALVEDATRFAGGPSTPADLDALLALVAPRADTGQTWTSRVRVYLDQSPGLGGLAATDLRHRLTKHFPRLLLVALEEADPTEALSLFELLQRLRQAVLARDVERLWTHSAAAAGVLEGRGLQVPGIASTAPSPAEWFHGVTRGVDLLVRTMEARQAYQTLLNDVRNYASRLLSTAHPHLHDPVALSKHLVIPPGAGTTLPQETRAALSSLGLGGVPMDWHRLRAAQRRLQGLDPEQDGGRRTVPGGRR